MKTRESLHGRCAIPGVAIDGYGLTLPDPEGDGFLGDRASQTAFRDLLDDARKHARIGRDPFGDAPGQGISPVEVMSIQPCVETLALQVARDPPAHAGADQVDGRVGRRRDDRGQIVDVAERAGGQC